jgi:hypothetical protein
MGEVVILDVPTCLPIPVSRILEKALVAELSVVVVIGIDENGGLYFASSAPEAAEVAWMCQRAIYELHRMQGDDGAAQ